jgi:outer membrane biosynthesis protein TonB
MEIICKTCKKPFNANPIEVASASVNFSLGRKHTFYCDHCKAENPLSNEEFEVIKEGKTVQEAPAKPVAEAPKPIATAPKPQPKPVVSAPKPEPKPVVKPAAQPVAAPKPVIAHSEPVEAKPVAAPQPKEGTVVVDSLRIRKDHNTSAEVVAGLAYGNKVTILGTWTDGKNTWAQIGPDQWAAIEHNGKKMIEVA